MIRSVCSPVVLLFSAAAILVGCSDSESMMFIKQAQVPTPGQQGASCTYESSPSTLSHSQGVLDVALAYRYSAELLVGNQVVSRANTTQLRTETSGIQVNGVQIRVEDATGKTLPGYPVSIPATGYLAPGSGSVPGYGLVSATLLEARTGQMLAQQLQTRGTYRNVTSFAFVFGQTLGGTSVQSGEWRFPITVCYGCLVSFPADAIVQDATKNRPVCSESAKAMGGMVTAPCNVGQDDGVDCRICKTHAFDPSVCDP